VTDHVKGKASVAAILSLLGASAPALASGFAGRSLEQALDELQARGLSILYSSDLVKPDMQVVREPSGGAAREILEELVVPHGIRIREGPSGMLLLTRSTRPPGAIAPAQAPEVTEVVVTASRYAWVRTPQISLTRLTAAELRLAPNVGDDPLRTLARLPGAAATDLSAKLHVRGGAADEVLVRFDGLRLANPFHLKDFQSIFSAIDPALVGTIDVYTGGFPANFGDRMSGVVDIHSVRAATSAHREISASLYNAAALATDRFHSGRAEWAVSARRGNLDRVLDWSGMHLGEPSYSDVYARLAHQIGSSMAISANMLRFDDDIELADSDLEEQARARYRDRYYWVRLDAHPRASISGATLLARSDLESVREGEAEQPGISAGSLEDRREHTIDSLQTDWTWQASGATLLQLGGEWRHSTGHYRYQDLAEFDLVFDVPGLPSQDGRANMLELQRRGDHYGAYASLRVEAADRLMLESGLRWDRSTLSSDGGHWSPRASALYRLGDDTALRASWGRFVQAMSIEELPVSDGVMEFADAQRAEHWLLSFERRLSPAVDLRIEGYHKRYTDPQPRYENLLNRLVILPEVKPDRVRFDPVRARAMGIEASLRGVRSRPLFWWATYAWSRAEDELSNSVVPRGWDQEHALNFGVGWQGDRWELSVAGLWRSGWPVTRLQLLVTQDNAVLYAPVANTQRLETYIDIDARIARKFQFDSGASLTFFVEISNALNRRNTCCTEYELDDESEEPVFVTENIRSLPRLPSLGFIWRF
jgi:outer membrane receptor protein involved in Fe transport